MGIKQSSALSLERAKAALFQHLQMINTLLLLYLVVLINYAMLKESSSSKHTSQQGIVLTQYTRFKDPPRGPPLFIHTKFTQ